MSFAFAQREYERTVVVDTGDRVFVLCLMARLQPMVRRPAKKPGNVHREVWAPSYLLKIYIGLFCHIRHLVYAKVFDYTTVC